MTDQPTWWQKLVKLDPALVRGFIVTVIGLIAAVLNVQVADGTTQNIITFVLALFGLVAAVFIRPAVTPNAKVIVKDETPLSVVSTIKPGEAVAHESNMGDVIEAAKQAA